MAQIESYRDLRVWQEGMELAALCYDLSRALPRDELFAMSSQIRRAASSIPANIAEGHGREGKAELLHFLRVAQGSLKELETHLLVCVKANLLKQDAVSPALESADRLGKMLRKLIISLKSTPQKPGDSRQEPVEAS